jgi:hypothetical protein
MTDPANWHVSGRDVMAPHADGGDVLICRCATASVARIIVRLRHDAEAQATAGMALAKSADNEIAALQSLLSDYRAYNSRLQYRARLYLLIAAVGVLFSAYLMLFGVPK